MNAFSQTVADQATGTEAEHRAARLDLLAREKELNKRRDELAMARRQLPWVPVDKTYEFDGPDGRLTMLDLFGDSSQLIVYHFMLGPDWVEGCPSCSFWADSYDGTQVHLAARDAALVAVSRAPFAEIDAYRTRMGWSFRWVSSAPSDFNFDFDVSSTPEHRAAEYNYRPVDEPMEESPGLSVFARDDAGNVYHTYSTYSRGLDPFNAAYQLLDLTPKGRDEQDLPWTMAWLHRHDSY
jgi:predicted dithiol-disulfide oxidoreductase (DUF899 family)